MRGPEYADWFHMPFPAYLDWCATGDGHFWTLRFLAAHGIRDRVQAERAQGQAVAQRAAQREQPEYLADGRVRLRPNWHSGAVEPTEYLDETG